MNYWTAGYVADIGYTYGYYQELSPLRINFAFLNAGLACPAIQTACELGFGQGMSVNIHAAASTMSWYGTDFNSAQAGFAQDLAFASGASAQLFDQSFVEFANRTDLPSFDYIGIHGVWSWISEENRTVIVDFLRRKLKVGGVLYISYNSLPGWATMVPLRHLLTQHVETLGAVGQGLLARIDGALEFSSKLFDTNPLYARANPALGERFKAINAQDRHYLAHEYFNRDWLPMHFSEMAAWLEPAKLSFACSAHYLDHIDSVNLTPEQLAFLKEIPDRTYRETVRDFMVNQQFRRDYWVRGPRKLSLLEQAEELRAQRVVLVTHRPDVPLTVTGALGEATLAETVYTPILDILADHKPRTLGQLEQLLLERNVAFAQLQQAVMVLIGAGRLVAAQGDSVIPKAKRFTDKLNANLLSKARSSAEVSYLASPVIGGGIPVSRFQQLFLLALSQGQKKPSEWAQFAWQVLAAQGQMIIKEGKTLETPEQNLAALTDQAMTFAEKQLPIMRALQVCG